jgi:hypothetical protein
MRINCHLFSNVLLASEKYPEAWSSADEFSVLPDTAVFNGIERRSHCQGGGPAPGTGRPPALNQKLLKSIHIYSKSIDLYSRNSMIIAKFDILNEKRYWCRAP